MAREGLMNTIILKVMLIFIGQKHFIIFQINKEKLDEKAQFQYF